MLKINKSQISIFIVISAILVIVLLFLFFNNIENIFLTKPDKIESEIKNIVESCVEESSLRAAFLLGFQGGWIQLPNYVNYDVLNFQKRYLDLGFKIPNWDSKLDNIPTIKSMENEINNYVSEDAYSCILPLLREMEKEYLDIVFTNMTIKSQINKENILIDVDFPISFNEKNSEDIYKISSYNVILKEIRLGDLYSLALEIFNTEKRTNFVEELVLDQIYSASDYNDNRYSMPSEGMSFSCRPQIWTKDMLKDHLANLNNNNFKYLQFGGTYPKDYLFDLNLIEEYGLFGSRAYYENNYFINLANAKESYKNYEVETFMPSYQYTGENQYFKKYPYRVFEVTPSNGQIVKPMNIDMDLGAKIPIPCIQIYHHLYTLDYDLLIKVSDRNEEGENFFFQFPLRVLIIDNNPKDKPLQIISDEPLTATNEVFCSDEQKDYPTLVYALDSLNNEFLSNVNISYKCINLRCDIGETKKASFRGIERVDSFPQLDEKFPFCIGGEIIASKEGYANSKLRIDTTSDSFKKYEDGAYYEIKLNPLKSFKIDKSSFTLKFIDNSGAKRIFDPEDGFVYLNIENKELEFSSEVIWTNEEDYLDTLNFIDSSEIPYNLSVVYIDKDSNLRGLIEMRNWTPDISNSNYIEIVVPTSPDEIEEEEFLDFFNLMENLINDSQYSGYGVRLS